MEKEQNFAEMPRDGKSYWWSGSEWRPTGVGASYSFRVGCIEYRCRRVHPQAMTGDAFESRVVDEAGEPTTPWRRDEASCQWAEEILHLVAERRIYKETAEKLLGKV